MKSPGGVWDWSLPPPVAETGRRNVGNRKERLRDYASSPDRRPQRFFVAYLTVCSPDSLFLRFGA